MRTVNMDFIKSYDSLKDNIFQAKKQEYKQKNRKIFEKPEIKTLKKTFPWRTLTKLTIVAGLVYGWINYSQTLLDLSMRNNYISILDIYAFEAFKSDFSIKIKSLIISPKEQQSLSNFANYVYKNQIQKDLKLFNKTYANHKLHSNIHSKFKFWIFQFQNKQKCHYINQFGDVIQKEEISLLRIWKLPIWKTRKQTVISQQKLFSQYKNIIIKAQDKDNEYTNLQQRMNKNCSRINFLNKLNPQYQNLLTQCKQNSKISHLINRTLKNRMNEYAY